MANVDVAILGLVECNEVYINKIYLKFLLLLLVDFEMCERG